MADASQNPAMGAEMARAQKARSTNADANASAATPPDFTNSGDQVTQEQPRGADLDLDLDININTDTGVRAGAKRAAPSTSSSHLSVDPTPAPSLVPNEPSSNNLGSPNTAEQGVAKHPGAASHQEEVVKAMRSSRIGQDATYGRNGERRARSNADHIATNANTNANIASNTYTNAVADENLTRNSVETEIGNEDVGNASSQSTSMQTASHETSPPMAPCTAASSNSGQFHDKVEPRTVCRAQTQSSREEAGEAEAKRRRGDPVILSRNHSGDNQDLMVMGQPPVMLSQSHTSSSSFESIDEVLQEAANQLATLLDRVDVRWMLGIKTMMTSLRGLLERAQSGAPLAIRVENLQNSCFETHFGTVLRLLMATGWRPSMKNIHDIEFDGKPTRLRDGTSSVDIALRTVNWIEECVDTRTQTGRSAPLQSSNTFTMRVFIEKRKKSIVVTLPTTATVQELFAAVMAKFGPNVSRRRFVLAMAAFQPAHLRRSADGSRSLVAAGAHNGTVLIVQEPVQCEAQMASTNSEVVQLCITPQMIEDRYMMQCEDLREHIRVHLARGLPLNQNTVDQMQPIRHGHIPVIFIRNYCSDGGKALFDAVYASTHLCRMAPLLQIGDGLRMSFPSFSMPLHADSWASHFDAASTKACSTIENDPRFTTADRQAGVRMLQECATPGGFREAQLQCFVHGCAEEPRPVLSDACKTLISIGEDAVVTINGARIVMKSGDALVFRGTLTHPIHHGVAEVGTSTLPEWAGAYPFMKGARFVVDLSQYPQA